MAISPSPARDTTGPPRPSVVVSITDAPYLYRRGVTSIVLASGSATRLAVLRAAGLGPKVLRGGVDARPFSPGPGPELAGLLAEAKAAAVAAGLVDGLVVGCDSLLVLDGLALGKPASPAEAAAYWRAMSGRTGTLVTG